MRIVFFTLVQYRSSLLVIILCFAVAGVFFFGCADEKLIKSPPPLPINPTVAFMDHGECTLEASKATVDIEKCIAYEYDGIGELNLVSIGSWFNCCPDSLEGAISFGNRTINIVETEYLGPMSGCDCVCTFDFTYQLSDLPPGYYTIITEKSPPLPWDRPVTFELILPPYPATDTLCQIVDPLM